MNARPVWLALPLLVLASRPAGAEELPMDAATLAHALDRLATTARVLYVAAHPDDENTRLLTYLANGRHVTAAYLSMTRGGGGQNLISSEQDELLGVIRTHELLAARALDGAHQRFTRMRDFGYSKTAAETLKIWGHDEALADVVWVIRTFQPDVIITRFDEQPPNHGHHTASAILAREAFTAAADPARFPEQLALGAQPWKTERLVHNVSSWREVPRAKDEFSIDVGAYDPRFGLSYGELAALSRSQHKSQGFGVPGERGELLERFVPIAGSKPRADLLEGVTLGWSRFGAKAEPLSRALEAARAALTRDTPERAIGPLIEAHRALDALPASVRTRDARQGLDRIIAACAGLFVRATAAQPMGVPGGTVQVQVEVVQRRPASLVLKRLLFPGAPPQVLDEKLAVHVRKLHPGSVVLPGDMPVSAPYWLAEPSPAGRHILRDPKLGGEAEGPPALVIGVELAAGDRTLRLEAPVLHSWTDRVHGERLRRFSVVPPATVTPLREAVLFPGSKAGLVTLRVRAGQDALAGEVRLELPDGWRAEPALVPVSLKKAGDETTVQLTVKPPPGAAAISIRPAFTREKQSWSWREDVIDHPHLPLQLVLQPSRLRLVPLSLKLPRGSIGYVQGSGDSIAQDLLHAGARVELLDDDTLRTGELSRYSAIILGIRAYNTREVLKSAHARLVRYAEQGGTVIVQYNTHSRWSPLDVPVGPFPLTLGRDRITDETAALTAIDPAERLLRTPNRLGPEDFEGWVQERGLYFAESWDPRWKPVLRAADPGEGPLDGGLLVSRPGKGRWIYTGLAFFRQLPAGVPGAYRLLANLIAAR